MITPSRGNVSTLLAQGFKNQNVQYLGIPEIIYKK